MAHLTAFYLEVHDRLSTVLPTLWGPAEHLPRDDDGMVVPSAVLWPTPGTVRTRADGRTTSGRVEALRLVLVGPDTLSVLGAVDTARAVLVGKRMRASGHGGGPVTEAGFTAGEPTPEPGTDPVRVSVSVTLSAITKETR